MRFKPCAGRDACRDGDDGCLTCGRSWTEITGTRELTDALSAFMLTMGYDNPEEFLDYLTRKVRKKLAHAARTAQESL